MTSTVILLSFSVWSSNGTLMHCPEQSAAAHNNGQRRYPGIVEILSSSVVRPWRLLAQVVHRHHRRSYLYCTQSSCSGLSTVCCNLAEVALLNGRIWLISRCSHNTGRVRRQHLSYATITKFDWRLIYSKHSSRQGSSQR